MESKLKIVVFVASLANRTTGVELRDGKRIFGEKTDKTLKTEIHASFTEFTDGGIKLDVPPRLCSNGHRLELELEFTTASQKIRFHAQGTVSHAEIFLHDHDTVTVTFTRHDPTVWSMIQALYQNQQSEVLALFAGLRGIEP